MESGRGGERWKGRGERERAREIEERKGGERVRERGRERAKQRQSEEERAEGERDGRGEGRKSKREGEEGKEREIWCKEWKGL